MNRYTPKVQAILDAQIKTVDDVSGALVKAIPSSPYLFLVFKTKWAVFHLTRGPNGTEIELYQETPTVEDFGMAGLLNVQELLEQHQQEKDAQKDAEEAKERAELERLKAKYEQKS